MKVETIKTQLLPLLQTPKSVYMLAAETDYSPSTLNMQLRILEAAGYITRFADKDKRGTLWLAKSN